MISASILGWLGLEKQPEKVDENHKGTIHILRKHFYSTKLNLTPKLFTKTGFFVKTEEFPFQHYILTKILCCSLKFFSQ